jgi:hypothetical protein
MMMAASRDYVGALQRIWTGRILRCGTRWLPRAEQSQRQQAT